MFKSAATKIAHNSTLPALAINQDLRSLQDLITAEKTVIISLQRLATDLSKASEALKAWGLGEGDDLGDVLTASTTILTHFTSALSQYASHGHYMREQLKAVRTREESLDELKRRRRSLASKADAAEKKLHRMNTEHKNFVPQTELLNKLRDDIRGLDVDIMKDEASLGDFKRSATRTWVGLKFGGLIECCEKGVIAGEYGKLIVSEIPLDQTQPGLPRNPYLAHSRIGDLVAEAHRCVNEVRLSTVPATASQPLQQQLPQVPHVSDSPFMTQGAFSPSPYQQPQPRFAEPYNDDPSRRTWEQPASPSIIHPSTTIPALYQTPGCPPRSASSGVEPGQFSLIATPPPDHGQPDSFSSSVAQALAATTSHEPEPAPLPAPGRFSKDGPAPSYEASVVKSSPPSNGNSPSLQQSEQVVEEVRVDATPQPPPPPEAAEPVGQGPQARLARLLQNEDEDVSYEQSLDAAAAREVALELNTPSNITDSQTYTSPPGSAPSSPVRATQLERAPTYTEKPTSYHNQYGISPPPAAPSTPPVAQQQQYQGYPGSSSSPPHQQSYSYGYHDSPQPPPAGQSYQQQGGAAQDGYPDERRRESYNPYNEPQDAGNAGRPSISSPPQLSLNFSTQDRGYALPPVQPSPSVSIGADEPGGGGSKSRSPMYERPPNAPYMMTKVSSTSSLNSGGKISAAAFKRPSPRIGSNSGSPFASPAITPSVSMMEAGVQPLRVGAKRPQQQGGGEGGGQYDYAGGYVHEGESDVGAGVGTYYYNGVGGSGQGQGKFESK